MGISGIFNKAVDFLSSGMGGGSNAAEETSGDWTNKGWFGSLAQEKANEYMSANKERIPMVIEYIASKNGDGEETNGGGFGKAIGKALGVGGSSGPKRKSITMYINPSRLQFKNNKVIAKQYTRGGIFYHHYGDDNMTISLSGSCGLSGMAGIQKLDEAYRMSGVLLRYGENSSGPVKAASSELNSIMDDICKGNIKGALGKAISSGRNLKEMGKNMLKETAGGVISAITGRGNNGLQSSKVAGKVASVIAGAVGKNGEAINSAAGSLVGVKKGQKPSALQTLGIGILTSHANKFADKLLKKVGLGGSADLLNYDKSNRVYFEDLSDAQSDILDELEDEWRPRQIWIYFEDHVYIGHFNSFNYSRSAESVNIQYDMQFTVLREIIVTSYSPKLPGFEAAEIVH